MLIPQILLLAALALVIRLLAGWMRAPALRGWMIFVASVVALYWLQPVTPIRYLDFWLPTATLTLTALGWLLTAAPGDRFTLANLRAMGALGILVLLVGLSRYLGGGDWLLHSRPPAVGQVIAALLILGALLGGLGWMQRSGRRAANGASEGEGFSSRWTVALLAAGIFLLIGLLVVLKTPTLALQAAQWLRAAMGQKASLATALDIRWLGFSYICFRLIHTLRDRQTGRLPSVELRDYASYVIFYPSLIAGPIDRLEHFQPQYCEPLAGQDPRRVEDFTEAGRRLAIGLLKKFVLADTLALVALSPQNALQARGSGWLWLMLYAYALLIYFDFSGYTDIAIGMGRILGITLPENFAAPYRRPNLTQFWNSWHMSLTFWFRAYYFNPLVRWLRGRQVHASPLAVLFISQVTTMLLIGLWHGVTWNFVLWGLWHGLGLFFQNRWTEFARPRLAAVSISQAAGHVLGLLSTLLTFHYVALGWVWFVLPDPSMAGQVLVRLVGAGF